MPVSNRGLLDGGLECPSMGFVIMMIDDEDLLETPAPQRGQDVKDETNHRLLSDRKGTRERGCSFIHAPVEGRGDECLNCHLLKLCLDHFRDEIGAVDIHCQWQVRTVLFNHPYREKDMAFFLAASST